MHGDFISELGRALIVAAAILDKPNADPDSDEVIMARQLSRLALEAQQSKSAAPTATAAILAQRGSIYGPFINNAVVSQEIKSTMWESPNWNLLTLDAKEALDLIAMKMSRILTGTDPHHEDNWRDIAGYATLVADALRAGQEVKTRANRFEGVGNAG